MEDKKEQTKTTIAEKVDGLLQYQLCLPFAETPYSDFCEAMKNVQGNDVQEVLKDLKDYFSEKDNHKWEIPETEGVNIEDLFKTSFFQDENDKKKVDFQALRLFAVFACRTGTPTAIRNQLEYIARQSRSKNQ